MARRNKHDGVAEHARKSAAFAESSNAEGSDSEAGQWQFSGSNPIPEPNSKPATAAFHMGGGTTAARVNQRQIQPESREQHGPILITRQGSHHVGLTPRSQLFTRAQAT